MKIKSITLKNFGLFKSAEFNLADINIIKGINLSDPETSSNGSGKSTILNAILFALYGNVPGINLIDLIHLGTKEAIVKIELDDFVIVRKIPTKIQIFVDSNEIQFNTNTLKQEWINDRINNFDYFQKYRFFDKRGINILDLGITSLRKVIMSLIDDLFTIIRKKLLEKKNEREIKNINKRLYNFYLSDKKLERLKTGLDTVIQSKNILYKEILDLKKVIQNQRSDIQSKEKMIYYKKNETKKAKEGICPILKTKCEKISKSLNNKDNQINLKISEDIQNLENEIKKDKITIEPNLDYLSDLGNKEQLLSNKINKTKEYIMKLKEAFKFIEYKYTLKDVELYTSAIKILDEFAGWYIQRWLDNLAIIINDLLRQVNLEVKFSADKQFITIIDEKAEFKYNLLSSGQKVFLNAVFKLAILLNKGNTDGIILIDEGINNLDLTNLHKFLTIIKGLPMQFFLIYQNLDEISDVNLIEIERNNNLSKIKEY